MDAQQSLGAPRARPEIFSIAPYKGGEGTLAGHNRVIKLSSNEGAFGVPPSVLKAVADALTTSHRYPDGSATVLRNAIGAHFGLDPKRIICGNGSDEIIAHLANAYSGPGTEVLMSAHGFSIYEIASVLAGATVRKVAERNLTADPDAILASLSARTRIVFLANPNNPTGTLLNRGEIAHLRAGLPPDVLLVLDSAYAEYVEDPEYSPGEWLVESTENTVMTRTFSKIYGMGGMRLGWAYAPIHIVDTVNRLRQPFSVNALAQVAGIAALSEPGWVEKGRAHNSRARAWLAEALTAAGIHVWPSNCNFLLADFGSPDCAAAADAALRQRGIIVRAMATYALPSALRITIGTDDECQQVADALTAFMRQQSHV